MTIKIANPAQQPAIDFDRLWIAKFSYEHLSPAEHRLEAVGIPYGLDVDDNVVRAKTRVTIDSNNLLRDLAAALVAAGKATDAADAAAKLAAARAQLKTWLGSGTVTVYHMVAAFEVFKGQIFDLLSDDITFDTVT